MHKTLIPPPRSSVQFSCPSTNGGWRACTLGTEWTLSVRTCHSTVRVRVMTLFLLSILVSLYTWYCPSTYHRLGWSATGEGMSVKGALVESALSASSDDGEWTTAARKAGKLPKSKMLPQNQRQTQTVCRLVCTPHKTWRQWLRWTPQSWVFPEFS